jgi:hemoglobin-like flavoprotein
MYDKHNKYLILKNYFNKRKQEENDQYKSKYRAILIL